MKYEASEIHNIYSRIFISAYSTNILVYINVLLFKSES